MYERYFYLHAILFYIVKNEKLSRHESGSQSNRVMQYYFGIEDESLHLYA